jgi:spore maturation protein CgeB
MINVNELDGQSPEVQIEALKYLLQSADERAKLYQGLYERAKADIAERDAYIQQLVERHDRIQDRLSELTS